MLGNILGTGDTGETRTDQVPVLMENASAWGRQRICEINKYNLWNIRCAMCLGEQYSRGGGRGVPMRETCIFNTAVSKSLTKMFEQRPEAVRSKPCGGRESSQCKGTEVPPHFPKTFHMQGTARRSVWLEMSEQEGRNRQESRIMQGPTCLQWGFGSYSECHGEPPEEQNALTSVWKGPLWQLCRE